jgi:simple sugar transport system permease protein
MGIFTRIKIEKQYTGNIYLMILVGILSIIGGLLVSSAIFKLGGHEPLTIYKFTFSKIFLTRSGFAEILVTMAPLVICSLAAVIPAKAKLWNIGIHGQFIFGAFAATWVALTFPELPAYLLIPFMILASAVVAGIYAVITVLPRIYFNISEIITTLLTNYVAALWVAYVVYEMWNDPTTAAPQTPIFTEAAKLPILLSGTRVHAGLFISLLIAIIVYFLFRYSVWGYEIRVIGEGMHVAEYSGVNFTRHIFIAFFVGGALAGLAGMLEVSGVVHRLQPVISPTYGFTAITIAWLSRLSPISCIFISFLFAGLLSSGFVMQMQGLPAGVVLMFQGTILFFVLAGELLTFYKVRLIDKE